MKKIDFSQGQTEMPRGVGPSENGDFKIIRQQKGKHQELCHLFRSLSDSQ